MDRICFQGQDEVGLIVRWSCWWTEIQVQGRSTSSQLYWFYWYRCIYYVVTKPRCGGEGAGNLSGISSVKLSHIPVELKAIATFRITLAAT